MDTPKLARQASNRLLGTHEIPERERFSGCGNCVGASRSVTGRSLPGVGTVSLLDGARAWRRRLPKDDLGNVAVPPEPHAALLLDRCDEQSEFVCPVPAPDDLGMHRQRHVPALAPCRRELREPDAAHCGWVAETRREVARE